MSVRMARALVLSVGVIFFQGFSRVGRSMTRAKAEDLLQHNKNLQVAANLKKVKCMREQLDRKGEATHSVCS